MLPIVSVLSGGEDLVLVCLVLLRLRKKKVVLSTGHGDPQALIIDKKKTTFA